ncbi:hypothetical protein [Paraburkholderia azotifigens]|uniref:TetR family transcriptional regulator n=1 Tax=Paraburkholderia azotifigens TaxID=2057004 RepID=A0ABU9RFI7_9BURK
MKRQNGLSGKERGDEYARRMVAYLETASTLPMLNGSINVTAIAEAAGVPTQSLYKNPTIRAALQDAKLRLGVRSWRENKGERHTDGDHEAHSKRETIGKPNQLEKRLSVLERRYGAVLAENYQLRQDLKNLRLQLSCEDMMIDSGRRVALPTGKAGCPS